MQLHQKVNLPTMQSNPKMRCLDLQTKKRPGKKNFFPGRDLIISTKRLGRHGIKIRTDPAGRWDGCLHHAAHTTHATHATHTAGRHSAAAHIRILFRLIGNHGLCSQQQR